MTIDLVVVVIVFVLAVVNPWMPVSEIQQKARRRRMKHSAG